VPNQALTDRFEGDAFFISEVGQPEFPPRINVGMQADLILDLVLEPFVLSVSPGSARPAR